MEEAARSGGLKMTKGCREDLKAVMDLFDKFDPAKNLMVPMTGTAFLSIQVCSLADYSERWCLSQSSSKTGKMPDYIEKIENSFGKNIKMVKGH